MLIIGDPPRTEEYTSIESKRMERRYIKQVIIIIIISSWHISLRFYLFVCLFMREREREHKEREKQKEKLTPH